MKQTAIICVFLSIFFGSCSLNIVSKPKLLNGGSIYSIENIKDSSGEPGFGVVFKRTFRAKMRENPGLLEARKAYSEVSIAIALESIQFSEAEVSGSSSIFKRTAKGSATVEIVDLLEGTQTQTLSISSSSSLDSTYPFLDTFEQQRLMSALSNDLSNQIISRLVRYDED